MVPTREEYAAKRIEKVFCICKSCGNKFASKMKIPVCTCGSRNVKVIEL